VDIVFWERRHPLCHFIITSVVLDSWPIHRDILYPPPQWLSSRNQPWKDSYPIDITSQWKKDWNSALVVNSHLVADPTVRQPGFDFPRRQWSLLNRFRICFFNSAVPRDWLGRTPPKWSVFSQVGRKTLTEVLNCRQIEHVPRVVVVNWQRPVCDVWWLTVTWYWSRTARTREWRWIVCASSSTQKTRRIAFGRGQYSVTSTTTRCTTAGTKLETSCWCLTCRIAFSTPTSRHRYTAGVKRASIDSYEMTQYTTHNNRFRPFGTTRVSRCQKKHSPTHHPDHHPIFISFFCLLRFIASFLFKLLAWKSFCTISFHVLFGLPLGLEPCTSYSIHFFTQSMSSFCNTWPYHHNLFCCSINIISSIVFLSTPYLELYLLP